MKRHYINNLEDSIIRARGIPILTAAKLCGFSTKQSDKGQECTGPCPVCGGNDRFSLVLCGTKTGIFNCRHCGLKGNGSIDLVKKIKGFPFIEAVYFLNNESSPPFQKERAYESKSKEKIGQKHIGAQRLWDEGLPWEGTFVEKYLVHRGIINKKSKIKEIQSLWISNIRFVSNLPYYHQDKVIWTGPAMIARIQDSQGNLIGVHRTWLDRNLDTNSPTTKKGYVHIDDPNKPNNALPAKKVLGQQKGGAIRLVLTGSSQKSDFPGDPKGPERLFLAEGIETLLSVYASLHATKSHLIDRADFWCGINLGNLTSIPIPKDTKEVFLIADADSDLRLIQKKIQEMSDNLRSQNKKFVPIYPPKSTDFNDILMEPLKIITQK